MIDNINSKFNNKGVSPVIGVILMVVVTVAITTLTIVSITDLGQEDKIENDNYNDNERSGGFLLGWFLGVMVALIIFSLYEEDKCDCDCKKCRKCTG